MVFTREGGTAINKDMVTGGIAKARKRADVKDLRFHDLRHTTLTNWVRRGIPDDQAMLASGHSSYQMHQRYVHLRRSVISKAFGLESRAQTVHNQKEPTEREQVANT